METIKIKQSEDTPGIILDPDKEHFEIYGKSLPEDVGTFFEPVLNWLDEYADDPNTNTTFDFRLSYFNTASSKSILDILMKLEELNENGNEVAINWYYDEDDEDMFEAGEEYSEIVDIPFSLQKA